MKRVAATALLAMGLLQAGAVVAQDGSEAAAEQARAEASRQLKAPASEFTVVTIEPKQWTDSSLGCRKPNAMYLDVISDGYVVVLERKGQRHQVNVAGSRAVMCDPATRLSGTVRQPLPGMNARGLDQMMERARKDLAQRLGADPAKIRLAGTQPHRWDDSALGCPREGEAIQAGPVDGFKLALKYSGRTYTYHTDRQDVRPCPAIEAE